MENIVGIYNKLDVAFNTNHVNPMCSTLELEFQAFKQEIESVKSSGLDKRSNKVLQKTEVSTKHMYHHVLSNIDSRDHLPQAHATMDHIHEQMCDLHVAEYDI
nr:hypothetical protein [Tanacetum cinerariifolium]